MDAVDKEPDNPVANSAEDVSEACNGDKPEGGKLSGQKKAYEQRFGLERQQGCRTEGDGEESEVALSVSIWPRPSLKMSSALPGEPPIDHSTLLLPPAAVHDLA